MYLSVNRCLCTLSPFFFYISLFLLVEACEMKTNSFQLARPIYFKIPSKKWALCKFRLIDILFLLKWKRKKNLHLTHLDRFTL